MGLSKQNVVVNVAKTEGGYSASCDLLDGWVVAVRDSIDFYIDCAKEDGDSYPEIFDRDYRIEYRFDVQSLLCFYQNIFSFSALQYITGINQKQLGHYAAGRSKPRKKQAEKIVNGLHKLGKELAALSFRPRIFEIRGFFVFLENAA